MSRRTRWLLLAVAAVLALAGCLVVVFMGHHSTRPPAQPVTSHSASPSVSPTPTPTSTPSRPVKLLIPSIGVDAAIEVAGVDANNNIATPQDSRNAAWYSGSVLPGESGNAFIEGHLNWYTGPGRTGPVVPRVFWSLGKVKNGDQVQIVQENGTILTFQVDRTYTLDHDDKASGDSLLKHDGPPTITLETCSGDWSTSAQTYQSRLIVHATLIG